MKTSTNILFVLVGLMALACTKQASQPVAAQKEISGRTRVTILQNNLANDPATTAEDREYLDQLKIQMEAEDGEDDSEE